MKTGLNEHQKRWVINKSSRVLTDEETKLLAKGMNYAISPDNIPNVDLITGVELTCKNLESDERSQVRAEAAKVISASRPPKSNLNKSERNAIKDLRNDDSITILPADKGRCTVVMDVTDYEHKVKELLNDTNTYTLLKRDPNTKYKDKLKQILKRLCSKDTISQAEYYHLMPDSNTVPRFYGLPKIHKPSCPLRPIVSSIGSITYNVAKLVAGIISPLVGQSPHHIKNSTDFAERVSHIHLQPGEVMVS